MDASIAHECVAGEAAGHQDAEAALFAAVRGHAEAVIAWAGSEQALGLEHEQLESETMQAGLEFMRLLTQAHLDLRTAASSAAPTWWMRTETRALPARTGTSGPG